MKKRKRKSDMDLLKEELELTSSEVNVLTEHIFNISTFRKKGGWQADIIANNKVIIVKVRNGEHYMQVHGKNINIIKQFEYIEELKLELMKVL